METTDEKGESAEIFIHLLFFISGKIPADKLYLVQGEKRQEKKYNKEIYGMVWKKEGKPIGKGQENYKL